MVYGLLGIGSHHILSVLQITIKVPCEFINLLITSLLGDRVHASPHILRIVLRLYLVNKVSHFFV